MGDNVLYVLGAGASCEAVPLVKDFPKRLADFAKELSICGSLFEQDKPEVLANALYDWQQIFIKALDWLAKEASQNGSVDTLAKKFFLKDDLQNLKKLKAVLSSFLIVEQARRPVDRRYVSFLASMLHRDGRREFQMPSNLQILTWNYDTQFEKAFHGFAENNGVIYQKISHNDRIHRINGCCGKTPEGHWGKEFSSVWESPDYLTAMRHGVVLFRSYFEWHNTSEADIRFAWEYLTEHPLPSILPNLKETNVAVVIGYSFPFFNREVDKKIFAALPNLKRVYLQYPKGVHDTIKGSVQTMRPDLGDIQYVSSDNPFHIPDEFSGPA